MVDNNKLEEVINNIPEEGSDKMLVVGRPSLGKIAVISAELMKKHGTDVLNPSHPDHGCIKIIDDTFKDLEVKESVDLNNLRIGIDQIDPGYDKAATGLKRILKLHYTEGWMKKDFLKIRTLPPQRTKDESFENYKKRQVLQGDINKYINFIKTIQ